MITPILTQIGLPVLMSIVGAALDRLDSPIAKSASQALQQVDQAVREGQISSAEIESLNKHAQEVAEIKLEEHKISTSEINKTLRAESLSQDWYVRRMRPTFGYIMAVSWAAQMIGIAYIMIFDTDKIGIILNAMSSLSMIWTVGLSVLGVYVYKRSEDKKWLGRDMISWN